MPTCPKCQRLCKTAQGLSGHMRFRHQMTVPKQDLPLYAKDRLEKAEDENARLREQVARLQRQCQDQETFFEKKMAEQKVELERAQERKLAEQHRATVLKQREEQMRSERAHADDEAVAALKKQIQDLQRTIEQLDSQTKKIDELGKNSPEVEGQGTNTRKAEQSISDLQKARQHPKRERDSASGSSLLPPLPHPLHPVSSLKEIERWFFGEDESI